MEVRVFPRCNRLDGLLYGLESKISNHGISTPDVLVQGCFPLLASEKLKGRISFPEKNLTFIPVIGIGDRNKKVREFMLTLDQSS